MKNPNSKNGKSLLFTCQNAKSLDILERDGRFINKREYVEEHLEDIAPMILKAYDWFVGAASKRIKKPEDVQYQIWCTVSSDVCMRPIENEIIYVLEVPDEEIIYFNSFKWDYVINHHYVPFNNEDLEKYEKEMERKGFANTYEFLTGRYAGKFPLEERKIKESWNRVFDIDKWNTREVQANLWEIKKEWVKCILKSGEVIPEEYYVK
ncbi:DUF3841 domain-containing protein [Leptotrichia sp. OH3620_COT-345]|uniref:DUF3841 domain-containing protein n=1 Tax=Leptotrichia sp. OH3620_COT-345 TaxID=2491048 RepID=UPI000F654B67|nr:DUF3841 domain-containing protein [Leptotrichia sp. OH3620_COT-345]RRD39609.1 DUF3841 domain-containing protein [Leptotrichia sp. OH3620_COT-345]